MKRLIAILFASSALFAGALATRDAAPASAKTTREDLETALYARAEFFGAQAIVPLPTAEARARVAALRDRSPNDAEIVLKLAELDEKLNRVDDARADWERYVEIEKGSLAALGRLAAFHARRARFVEEAVVRERMIAAAPREERPPILRSLIELAGRHRLEKYQRPDFFRQLIASDPGAFEVVKQFIDHQAEKGEHADALQSIRQYKASFPEQRAYFLDKEVAALDKLGRVKEAEQVYVKAFDPFWSEDESQKFYQNFLSEHDRLRAYGRELKARNRRDPADFDTAVRLFHYLHFDYGSSERAGAGLFLRLEKARGARGAAWTDDELATMARLLIADGQVDQAARFLYTLQQRGTLASNEGLRGKILYEIFRLLSDASAHRTPLTAGDLRFYQDVAASDPHPGMLGGVLSLVLADTNPGAEFRQEEEAANEQFNLAAAYRVFLEYRKAAATSPEMAQMYVDLIRRYAGTRDAKTADALLAEFEARYPSAPQFAEVALRLADCYIHYKQYDKERALYQRLLDHLGARRKAGVPLLPSDPGADDMTARTPATTTYPPFEVREEGETESRVARFRPVALSLRERDGQDDVTYQQVLLRYVSSLARENRAGDILALYANEIRKYPDEQGLYEQQLAWQGQTNLLDEQLRAYQEAIRRFPSRLWTDRLARWYLRRERKDAFESFSRDLLEKMNDAEVESYFARFVANGAADNASAFEARLYLSSYTRAHERFPHNLKFVEGLLAYYAGHKQWEDWRRLLAEYYFESKSIRDRYLARVASEGRLREAAATAGGKEGLPYKLFRADAAVWLTNYEDAVDQYRELDRLYPNTPEFAGRLVALTRSFGQKDIKSLEEAARVQLGVADAKPASAADRTTAGELYAELGDYKRAAAQWDRLLDLGAGDKGVFLDAATVYWDYYQYDDALRVLRAMRRQMRNDSLYAFQIAAILESRHQTNEAVAEYVKDLDQDSENYGRAKRRLIALYEREGMPARIRAAIAPALARARNRDGLVLGYVELLKELDRKLEAAALLRREIARSRSQSTLQQARRFFLDMEDEAGEIAALRRLAANARTERFAISFQLQLADHAARAGRKNEAAAMVGALVNRFPSNYGVLTEGADFYWRLGRREQAVALLGRAMGRSRGRFRYIFARKLAARQIDRGQWGAAERVLDALYRENPRNFDVFDQLTKIYVHGSRPDALRDRYRETIRAIQAANLDRVEIRDEIDTLRGKVIEAFTQLRDYNAAIEQHIEIINRDPDEQKNVEEAVRYAKRYGGADTLLAYYAKTAQQAYKDYRWNLVLARLHDARGDSASATRELRRAIENQPEKIELHAELADVSLRAKDYDTAVGSLRRALALSNDDPAYLKKLAETYDKAGRKREADAVRARLPVEAPKTRTSAELFAEAESKRGTERAKSAEAVRKAYEQFATDIYKHELRDYELMLYVELARTEEPLDRILRRLWELRARVREGTTQEDNLLAGKARTLLGTLDRVIPDAVGRAAAENATGAELDAVDREIRVWIQEARGRADGDEALALLFNLGRRAKLGRACEEALLARKDLAAKLKDNTGPYHNQLNTIVGFYAERGAFERILPFLREEEARDADRAHFNYRALIVEYARLTGNREEELKALREEYEALSGAASISGNALLDRYFEMLLENGEAGRAELRRLTERNHPARFQMIGFLVRREERGLARAAIERAPLPASWKASRLAELSALAGDLDPETAGQFLLALQPRSIGEMIAARPDPSRALTGDNWFRLAGQYGKWLALSEKAKRPVAASSADYLPAMIENRPKDADAQWRLGVWYLEHDFAEKAAAHFQLALELRPGDKRFLADLGSAEFKRGRAAEARQHWARLLAAREPSMEDASLYLRTLRQHGLAADTRATLRPMVLRNLADEKTFDASKPLVRALAASFGKAREDGGGALTPREEAEKAAFLRELCEGVRGRGLPEMVLRESLVRREDRGPFYELTIARSEAASRGGYDYDFAERLRRHAGWTLDEVEESLDHQTEAEAKKERENKVASARLDWQREYLTYLLARRRDADAAKLAASIEQDLKGRFPRPAWLRLARLQLDVRDGRVPQAMAGLQRYARIAVSERIEEVLPPSLERVNQAAAMLRGESRAAEADELQRAAYERAIALEEYQTAPFLGLARQAFQAGDADRGLKLLRWMLALGRAETRETTAAELAALDWVKARAVESVEPSYSIQESEALASAADTAAEFGQFALAVECRQRLSTLQPENRANHIELARAQAALGRSADALATIAPLVTESAGSRSSRWRAVWIAAELAAGDDAARDSFAARLKSSGADAEMIAAFDTLSQYQRKRMADAASSAAAFAQGSPAPQPALLAAFLELGAGRPREALRMLTGAFVDPGDASIAQPFDTDLDEPRWALTRLYARADFPRAALRAGNPDERLRGRGFDGLDALEIGSEPEAARAARFTLLSARSNARQVQSRVELLGLLSAAAESIGETARAIELERARFDLLATPAPRRESKARIETLQAKRAAPVKAPLSLTYDSSPVSSN